jgi:hypothetical protein
MVIVDFTQEIAGFVLAAIPLMISGLEHYRENAEVLESWWKIKREYQKCMRNLKYHKVSFEENLEELLLPLIADEDKLQQLLDDPGRLNFMGDLNTSDKHDSRDLDRFSERWGFRRSRGMMVIVSITLGTFLIFVAPAWLGVRNSPSY